MTVFNLFRIAESSRSPRLRPRLERLEERAVPTAAGGAVPLSYLETVVPDGQVLAKDFLFHLSIVIDGQTQTVPGGIGLPLGQVGEEPIHTHNTSGLIHVESTENLPFRLQDFFRVWGRTFSRNDILDHATGAGEKITMTVNGRPSQAFGSLLLKKDQQVVIHYGPAHPSR